MVTYPIDFPSDVTVNQLKITPLNSVARSMSKFSYAEKVYDFGGEAWQIEGSLPLMDRDVAEKYVSFLFKLKGRKGTFLFPLPSNIFGARGSWGGTPVVDGGSQTGNTLNIRGLPTGITNVIREGDLINLGTAGSTRLYRVLDNVNSDGSGEASLTIWPSLRTSPTDGDSITYQNPKLLLRLDDNTSYNIDTARKYFASFKAMESL